MKISVVLSFYVYRGETERGVVVMNLRLGKIQSLIHVCCRENMIVITQKTKPVVLKCERCGKEKTE